MAIRVDYTPLGAVGEAAQLAGQAEAVQRLQDKAHQEALQRRQLAAAAQRQAIANIAAAQRQATQIDARAKANEIAHKRLIGAKLTDAELLFERDAHQVKLVQETEAKRAQAEREKRRQWTPKQKQKRQTIRQQIQDIQTDPSFTDPEKQTAASQRMQELNSMRPMGEIPQTTEENFKATTYRDPQGNIWGPDSKGVFKVLLKARDAEAGYDDKTLTAAFTEAKKIVDEAWEDKEFRAASTARKAKKEPVPGQKPTTSEYLDKAMEILAYPQLLKDRIILAEQGQGQVTKETTTVEPQSYDEFIRIVQGIEDEEKAKAYYNKWVSKWR